MKPNEVIGMVLVSIIFLIVGAIVASFSKLTDPTSIYFFTYSLSIVGAIFGLAISKDE